MGKPAFMMAVAAVAAMALSGCAAAGELAATGSSAPVAPMAAASDPAVDTVSSGAADTADSAAAAVANSSSGAAAVDSGALETANAAAVDGSITAQATGTVSGTPDVVTIVIGVQTRSTSAQTALDDNNKRAADVIGVLKDSGVAPADLKTSQLSITPSYDDKGQQITGYQVTNMVTAKLRDIGTAGAVIDAAGRTAGDAVRVQQLSFSIDDDSAVRAQARADAVNRAQAQAKQMADAAGIQLGAIRSITETPASMPTVYPAMAAGDTAAAPVPIEPGSQELNVVVQVVYAIAG